MDGLSEDSTLLSAILAADFIDRVTQNWLYFLGVTLTFWGYHTCVGKLDIWLTLCFITWKYFTATILLQFIDLKQIGVVTGITLAIYFFGCYIQQRACPRNGNGLTGDARPRLIPSHTTHTRLFPRKHSFSYSQLSVGVPVDYSGNVNGFISNNEPSLLTQLRRLFRPDAWFYVNPTDHLRRQHSPRGLRGKLYSYLESEDLDPSQYPHAYLVTSPRFLGFGFSPVSFWFLYSPEKVLSAIVVEMHSIFGERHSYFTTRDFDVEVKHIQHEPSNDQGLQSAQVKAKVQKGFHVSPFNSRKGFYSILASDPLGPGSEFRGLDITLSLFSSKGHPKLVANLVSEKEAIDPCDMTVAQTVGVVLNWFWPVAATFPRFIKECAVLFYIHNLHFWYRPEPLKSSIGRLANDIEKSLEVVFRKYLRSLVERSPTPIVVRYIPSGDPQVSEQVMRSPSETDMDESTNEIKIKILTPVFYSRFVHYAHDSEAIFCELAESRTFWTDRPEQLTKIFLKKGSPPLHSSSLVDYLWFQIIKSLRRRPRKIERPLTSAAKPSSPNTGIDIRDFRMSSMDAFVIGKEDDALKKAYRTAVLRLFVADRIAFGSTTSLGMMGLLGRVGMSWALASLIAHGFS
ncbi:hypothetical protein LB507_007182 [Fusarium sp. FIESC RH6]|nr:hypothetical protein LB507_007182 [Fusarium sp. FIESC RH6]